MGAGYLIKSVWYWFIKFYYGLISWAGITAICLILFSVAVTWFYWYLATVSMDWVECRWFVEKWRNTILGLGTWNVFIFYWAKVRNNIQEQFLWAYSGLIVFIYGVVMGVHFHKIQYPYQFLIYTDIAVGVVTLAIIINAIIHQLYNDEW